MFTRPFSGGPRPRKGGNARTSRSRTDLGGVLLPRLKGEYGKDWEDEGGLTLGTENYRTCSSYTQQGVHVTTKGGRDRIGGERSITKTAWGERNRISSAVISIGISNQCGGAVIAYLSRGLSKRLFTARKTDRK